MKTLRDRVDLFILQYCFKANIVYHGYLEIIQIIYVCLHVDAEILN